MDNTTVDGCPHPQDDKEVQFFIVELENDYGYPYEQDVQVIWCPKCDQP